jgi:putative Mg2+ transporter-C (MgtC) family protein
VIPEVEWWDVLVRLLVAAGLTGAIGLERELRDRAAGLRTHMLVGIGAALFTIVSAYAWGDFRFSTASGVVFDPTRIAAQIVTGIGFLGAGAIIRQGLSVRGLTTAASLWIVAAIGMAAGAGYYSAALIATGIVLVGLGPFRWLEGGATLARFRRAGRQLEIDITREHSIAEPLAVIDERRVRVSRVQFSDERDRRRLRVELDVPLGPAEERLVEDLASLDGVVAVRWSE